MKITKQVDAAQLASEIAAAHGWADPAPLTTSWDGTTGEVVVYRGDADEAKVQATVDTHTPDPDFGVPDEDRQVRLLRAKAQQVWAGDGTFTAAQVQKILAGLVLRATR